MALDPGLPGRSALSKLLGRFSIRRKLISIIMLGAWSEQRPRTAPIRLPVATPRTTNRDLNAAVEEGRFRADLYYRLSAFPLVVPPLRERPSDVSLLATHFLDLACRQFGHDPLALARSQLERLKAYPWPGNVRELRSVIERPG